MEPPWCWKRSKADNMKNRTHVIILVLLGVIFAFQAYCSFYEIAFPSSLSWFAGFVYLTYLFETYRYKALEEKKPGPEWERTDEKFIDPETGKPVVVYYHPQTGERLYVKEDDAAGSKDGDHFAP